MHLSKKNKFWILKGYNFTKSSSMDYLSLPNTHKKRRALPLLKDNTLKVGMKFCHFTAMQIVKVYDSKL